VGSTVCEVEVFDMGPGPNTRTLEEANGDELIETPVNAQDGRGLPVMRALMDDLEFVREDDTTTLRLIKRWDGLAPL
jgi:anti-sigma regulatory factor (Ser/Thr protein kinase)